MMPALCHCENIAFQSHFIPDSVYSDFLCVHKIAFHVSLPRLLRGNTFVRPFEASFLPLPLHLWI